MRVLIIGTAFSFPYGQGAASRVAMYAQALRSAGADVHVASLLPPSAGEPEEPSRGVYDGVTFEYAAGTRLRPRSFLLRRLLRLRTALRAWRLIAGPAGRRGEGGGSRAVLIYSGSTFWISLLTFMARTSGVVSVLDLCEFPLFARLRSVRGFLEREARRALAFPAVDGVVAISTYLEQYARTVPRPPAVLLVPVMVDTERFSPANADPEVPGRVVYCGALGRYDEVGRAITAFGRAAADLPQAELVLVGYGPPAREAQARALVAERGLEERVRFAGDVRRDDLPRLLGSAAVFVLPRPGTVSAVFGLPNKLGEYLAMGKPVIVNANGDVTRYLSDGVEAYVVDPHDEEAFATRLHDVLTHRDEAAAVGARGREAAVREFDYRRHGPRLVRFLERLATERQSAAPNGGGP
jgi:glycosyltransferase involved in cell wall biosynthesis